MSTTTYYEQFIAPLPDGLERKVLEILAEHIGEEQRIALRTLVVTTCGKYSETKERQVRQVIENLRLRGIPVMSESGKSGRWLAANEEERAAVIHELEARAGNLQRVINCLRSAVVPCDVANQPIQYQLF